jgi:predicted lactoylglutathione lyase
MAPRMMFLNLPVESAARSRAFYEALGFEVNEKFTDETCTCLVVSDTGIVMLLEHEKFAQFTDKSIVDPGTHATSLVSLSAESREEVDALVATALEHGGTTTDEPNDYGFMYDHSFVDPDGHGWGVVWMAPEAVEAGPAEYAAKSA